MPRKKILPQTSDPAFQAAARQFERELEQVNVQLKVTEKELEQIAERRSQEQTAAAPAAPEAADDIDLDKELRGPGSPGSKGIFGFDPSDKIFEAMEVDTTVAKGGVDWKGLGEEVAEEVAEDAVQRAARKAAKIGIKPPPVPKSKRQWHYVENEEAVGPIDEKELLRQLAEGELPWSTLVWHEGLAEWEPASRTELRDLVQPGKPPPVPKKKKR